MFRKERWESCVRQRTMEWSDGFTKRKWAQQPPPGDHDRSSMLCSSLSIKMDGHRRLVEGWTEKEMESHLYRRGMSKEKVHRRWSNYGGLQCRALSHWLHTWWRRNV
jgi:hypothetical protein